MTENESDSTSVIRTNEAAVTKLFRLLIVAEWILIFGGQWVSYVFRDSLPRELKTYLSVAPPFVEIVGPLMLVALLGFLIASIGLWFFRAWARPLFVGTVSLFALLEI